MVIARTTVALALLGALAACGSRGEPHGTTAPAAGDVDGHTYIVTGVTDRGQPKKLVTGTEVRVRFEDRRITLTAGCNTMSGAYTLEGRRLTVDQVSMTEVGCPKPRMDQDAWVAGLFAHPVVLEVGMVASITSGDVVLTLAPREELAPDVPLLGTAWVLDAVGTTGPDGSVGSVRHGVVATARFGTDGTVALDDGLNDGSGRVQVSGDRLRFGRIGWTAVGCADATCSVPQMSEVFAGEARFSVSEDRLSVTHGSTILVFRAR